MTSTGSLESLGDGLSRTRGAAVDLAFRVRGAGPAVVLLHGTSANHAIWEPVGDILEKHATVIALDQRGHGRSDKPARGYTGDDFVVDVMTVLDALNIGTAVVAGHSLGARNSWLAAARHPERVSGAVIVDYTPFVETRVIDELDARVALGFREFADVECIESYLRDRYPALPPGAIERRARWGYRQLGEGRWAPLASRTAMSQLIDGFRTPHDEEFRRVVAPMTHLRGSASTIVSEVAWEKAIADRPGDRWVAVDGADHYIPEELPDLIAAEILLSLGT